MTSIVEPSVAAHGPASSPGGSAGRLLSPAPLIAAAFLFAGLLARLPIHAGNVLARWSVPDDHAIWLAGVILVGAPVVWRTVVGALRGHFAADLVASLAIIAAVVLRDPLPGLIVVLMQTGGEALERYAGRRASDAVRALEEAAPRHAHRLDGEREVDIGADEIRPGDLIRVRPGELVPCDGEVTAGRSHVDTSALTGEPLPVVAEAGVLVRSGSINGEGPLTMRADRPASESQYARIVQLVRSAQGSKAPLQRLADRYAIWFTPITLLVCAVAWAVSGDAGRVLAVLVVATPCPLILATPVAVIGGINRAARRLVVLRHGTALEQVGAVDTIVFDKTGTLTLGIPAVREVLPAAGWTAAGLLRLAAAVEASSGHLLARSLVAYAREAGVDVPPADEVREAAGQGATGLVEAHRVHVGAREWVAREIGVPIEAPPEAGAAVLRATVAVDGAVAGSVIFADRLRDGVAEVLAELRTLGVARLLLLSGDEPGNARAVGAELGIDDARGGLLPEQKVAVVRELVAEGGGVAMVGDGTNDAPALAAATVGIAMAGHGGGITAEAADVVILVDDIARLPELLRISRRTMRIARQSIRVGLGLSGAAMLFAAAGLLQPVGGALLQEIIDVAVILNALRSSRSAGS